MRTKHMNSEQLEKRYKTDIKSAQGVIAMVTVITLIYIVRWLYTREFDFYFCTAFTEFLLKAAEFSPEYRGAVPNAAAIAGIVCYLAVYAASVILAQKKPQMLWFPLSLYVFDTVFLLVIDLTGYFGKFTSEYFIDIIFHVFILLFLIVGMVANKKLKELKELKS
ncbi:MAG: hypothetical protein MSH34_01590 [Oscillospiraceae bacterium]|nr:hypothetical protein [Oscillospiraceae bacterium]MDD7292066.1 hypothetical protein [Clostridiaceae bacterium]MDY5992022.1 hypothetical protein [Oscillospiraceae bacterium]